MPWELEISTIDVGQGESSLVIARDTAVGGQVRTMLIDAGEPGYAPAVHHYIQQRFAVLGIQRLDHILVTHYDDDHSGGVTSRLTADNFYAIVEVIAQAAADAVVAAMATPVDAAHQVAAAAAAAAAAACGGYDLPGLPCAEIAVSAGAEAEVMGLHGTDQDRAKAGANLGKQRAEGLPRKKQPKPGRKPQKG